MAYEINAIVRADGFTQTYGPFDTKEAANQRADKLRAEATRNAPFLSPATNAAFSLEVLDIV